MEIDEIEVYYEAPLTGIKESSCSKKYVGMEIRRSEAV
jgi:hypothetical protein